MSPLCRGTGMVWYGMAWYGKVWHGMAGYGMVWHGMVWHGMAWYPLFIKIYGMARMEKKLKINNFNV